MWLPSSFVLKHPPLDRCCQETEKCYVVFTVVLFNLRLSTQHIRLQQVGSGMHIIVCDDQFLEICLCCKQNPGLVVCLFNRLCCQSCHLRHRRKPASRLGCYSFQIRHRHKPASHSGCLLLISNSTLTQTSLPCRLFCYQLRHRRPLAALTTCWKEHQGCSFAPGPKSSFGLALGDFMGFKPRSPVEERGSSPSD